VTDEAYCDIRTVPPQQHWKQFENSWRALKIYTYLGKTTPFLVARHGDGAGLSRV
jgi:hypothetical protein